MLMILLKETHHEKNVRSKDKVADLLVRERNNDKSE